jgi:hypothetical protein
VTTGDLEDMMGKLAKMIADRQFPDGDDSLPGARSRGES